MENLIFTCFDEDVKSELQSLLSVDLKSEDYAFIFYSSATKRLRGQDDTKEGYTFLSSTRFITAVKEDNREIMANNKNDGWVELADHSFRRISEPIEKHDGHYAAMAIEAVDVMEQRIEYSGEIEDPKALYNLSQVLKYVMRAGLKTGQPWKKDIEKAQNYLNRALTGKWRG